MLPSGGDKSEFLTDENTSFNGFRWRLFTPDERFVQAVCQKYNLPDIIAKIINSRKVPFEKRILIFLHK